MYLATYTFDESDSCMTTAICGEEIAADSP
jgi:hypothetical protein